MSVSSSNTSELAAQQPGKIAASFSPTEQGTISFSPPLPAGDARPVQLI
jgi:hypothetical protein